MSFYTIHQRYYYVKTHNNNINQYAIKFLFVFVVSCTFIYEFFFNCLPILNDHENSFWNTSTKIYSTTQRWKERNIRFWCDLNIIYLYEGKKDKTWQCVLTIHNRHISITYTAVSPRKSRDAEKNNNWIEYIIIY